VLIATSNFVQNWWFLVVAAVGIGAYAAVKLLQQEHIRRGVHRWLLRVPLIGRVTRGLNTARFTRTLSILTASGVPALEALRISASVVANLPMRAAVEEAAIRVREGGAIGRSLAQSKLFPPITIHLIGSGEASGELDSMLERAANHQEREMDGLIAMMLSVLEPLLIVLMGLVVLAIVMAILLPIFQINQLVR
jgi:general secretion pathway protein F